MPASSGHFSWRARHNTSMKKSIALAAVLLCACALAQPAQAPQMNLPRVQLSAGMHLIDAQVAATPEQRETGLMFRKEMPQQEGMLFVFDLPAQQCFWMKNTVLPLSVAFVADDGTVVNTDEMAPLTLDSHCSAKPVRYVLEMNKGWFAKKGIKPGFRLQGTPFH
jgi:uncharacterized membrane protein (UPF0127 family)